MPTVSQSQISAVRRFNRFYTREVGLLRKTFLDTPWTLGEMRVLFEIANGDKVTATDIARELELDAAYLSRLLRGFEGKGLIARMQSKTDARVSHLKLTAKGRGMFDAANGRQVELTKAMLGRLKPAYQKRLTEAMGVIEDLLGGEVERAAPAVALREPRPGDFGWVVSRHAEIYGEEYGWGEPFEGLCAQIVADFANGYDPKLEKCWIAEVDGERAGCVFLVKDDPKAKKADVARIRLLLLDENARGFGLGKRLVDECVTFAKAKGYRRITLWTHEELTAARAIYAKAGFTMSGSETHKSWGKTAVSEFWDLQL